MTTAGQVALWAVLASVLVLQTRSQVLGDVFLYEAGKGEQPPVHFDPFPTLPADFGPEVPDDGVDGLLLVADPEDACQPLTFRYDVEPWVALISRSQHLHPTNCTFDVKVHNAELAGASAAIVYDDVYEALIIMSKPRDHEEPGIPAVFVSEKAGIIMRRMMTPGVTRVRIVPVSASAWMSLLMSAFLGFLALTVVLATFYVMRSWSIWLGRTRRRDVMVQGGFGAAGAQAGAQEGLPACAIRALPILIYERKPRRSSSTGGSNAPAGAAAAVDTLQQQQPSAPVPIAAAATGAPGGGHVAWMASSPAMPETPQASATAASSEQDLRFSSSNGPSHHLHSSAADTAVVLIESDSEADAVRHGAGHSASQHGWQPAGGLGQRLASSSSAMTSGLISLASLAAAGSRRVLLLGSQSAGDASSMSDVARAAAAGQPCDHASNTSRRGSRHQPAEAVDVPGSAAAAADVAAAASGSASPTGSNSCRSSLHSTDDEDGDVPEVMQSWPGAGGLARVVTGGPVGARGGATRHTCVVCLERYAAGDKVRVLPCQHRFHSGCIDPWLASRRLCPVCKHDASTWPSNSLQAALSGSVPLDTPPGGAVAAAAAAGVGATAEGGVSLLSAPLPAGMVSLVGRGYWFRRLRARLARASRRRQQQQQEQQRLLLGATGVGGGAGDAGAAAAAAVAAQVAAEAGLLQPPPAAVTLDVRGHLPEQQQLQTLQSPAQALAQQLQAGGASAGASQHAVHVGNAAQDLHHRHQQQQQRRRSAQHQRNNLTEPLLPAE